MHLDKKLMQWVFKMMKAKLEISYSSSYQMNMEEGVKDARNVFLPNQTIALNDVVKYAQVFEDRNGFQPNMSILDLLFCCGPAATGLLLSNNSRF